MIAQYRYDALVRRLKWIKILAAIGFVLEIGGSVLGFMMLPVPGGAIAGLGFLCWMLSLGLALAGFMELS